MILPLRIKNSEILPSPFTISKVLYGNDRANPYITKNKKGNNSLDLTDIALLSEYDINADIEDENDNEINTNTNTFENSKQRSPLREFGKCTYCTYSVI